MHRGRPVHCTSDRASGRPGCRAVDRVPPRCEHVEGASLGPESAPTIYARSVTRFRKKSTKNTNTQNPLNTSTTKAWKAVVRTYRTLQAHRRYRHYTVLPPGTAQAVPSHPRTTSAPTGQFVRTWEEGSRRGKEKDSVQAEWGSVSHGVHCAQPTPPLDEGQHHRESAPEREYRGA